MTEKENKELLATQESVKQVLQLKSGGAASLYFNNTINFIGEFLLYGIGIGCFVFPFIMKSVTPFHILREITENDKILEVIPSRGEINTFDVAIKAIILICGILFIYIGMNLRTIRKKNAQLYKAFKVLDSVAQVLDKQLIAAAPQPLKGDLKPLEPKDIPFDKLDESGS